jgi:hypothetical protein
MNMKMGKSINWRIVASLMMSYTSMLRGAGTALQPVDLR